MRSATPSLLACALALAACGDHSRELEAGPASGSYVLVRTAQIDLPAPMGVQGDCVIHLGAGELELTGTREYRSRFEFERDCPETGSDSSFDHRATGTYEVTGDSLRLVAANGATDGYGTLRGDTLELIGPAHTLLYARTR